MKIAMNIYRKIQDGGMNGYVDVEKDLIEAGITRYRHNRLGEMYCSDCSFLLRPVVLILLSKSRAQNVYFLLGLLYIIAMNLVMIIGLHNL